MTHWSSILAGATAVVAVAWAPGVARANTLDQACQELDRNRDTHCTLERPAADRWLLRTGYPVGTGRKATLEIVEARFCDAARQAGVSGRVLRSSELPGVLGKGAVVEWDCGPPAVSSAPRSR